MPQEMEFLQTKLSTIPFNLTTRTLAVGTLEGLNNMKNYFKSYLVTPTPISHTKSTLKGRDGDIKVAIVTGGTHGIGKELTKRLLKEGYKVYIFSRNLKKGNNVVQEFWEQGFKQVSFVQCDLSDLRNIRQACQQFKETEQRIDLLINNAGVLLNEFAASVDGYEMQFATSHLGHFCLVNELFSLILENKTRVINMASCMHYAPSGIDFECFTDPKKFHHHGSYALSKLCNVLFAKKLSSFGVSTCSVHPGAVNSGLYRNDSVIHSLMTRYFPKLIHLVTLTNEESVETLLPLCLDDVMLEGGYYWNAEERRMNKFATKQLADALWQYSQKAIDTAFSE